MLSPRAEIILKSIVGSYIEHAIPVASQSLIGEYGLKVSSATIRNEMMRLEEEGYIIRPHTSAGSVPSDKGYRFYVESLTDIMLPLDEQRLVSHLFHQVERRLDEWLSLAAAVMSQLARNISVVTVPKPADCQFKHLELVELQHSLALVVLVLRGARVKQQLVTFERDVPQAELAAVSGRLNAAYDGLTGSQIQAKDKELSPVEKQVTDCVIDMMRVEDEQVYNQAYLDGLHFMAGQPEFSHNRRLLALMELFEHRGILASILPRELPLKVQVLIGSENKDKAVQDCSVVIGRYGLPEEAIGVLGVVGPTRMPYARVISAVSYLSVLLSGLVAELYGKKVARPACGNNN